MNPDINSNGPGRERRGRDITDEEMNKFLAWLDADNEEAGQKYQQAHRCLTAIFVRRGYANAEEMADEAINRVIRRVARDDSFAGEDHIPYFVRVAYNLHLEHHRPKPAFTPPSPPPRPPKDDPELEDECLTQCLRRL